MDQRISNAGTPAATVCWAGIFMPTSRPGRSAMKSPDPVNLRPSFPPAPSAACAWQTSTAATGSYR